MASRFIVFFSAIIVLAQGSNILPIEQESEVAVHSGVVSSGAPVVVVSQGHPSVHPQPQRPIYGHGPVSVPVGGPHRVIGSGPRPYVAAPLRPAPVSYVRPATVVIPAPRVVVGPAVPIRQPHGVAAPIVVGSGHGNVHQTRHHGQRPY
ncbi:uncharacterized protein LOC108042530 [Drosophila rhopaloa]|uniref:Uncharacterized protein LOC108042530 n=1 Tax=Drosophila rhopaloa TaxID=1041015 RepID=A0A6P4EMT6_DRORH|nr:uncharacterized protein LOC108042530 [Drosophila rhopaloa]